MKLGGLDTETAFGMCLEEGAYDELMSDLRVKPGYEYNWPDEDAFETDPDEGISFERRTYRLPILFIANDVQDLMQKYGAFLTFLKGSKDVIMETDLPDPLRYFKVRFASLTAFKVLNTFYTNDQIGCKFILTLTDDHPLGYQPVPGDFIVDTDRNFAPTIVAMKGDSFRLEIELQDDGGGILNLTGMSYSINVMSVALELPNVLVVTASSGYMAGLALGEQPFVIKETKPDSTIKTIINGVLLVVE